MIQKRLNVYKESEDFLNEGLLDAVKNFNKNAKDKKNLIKALYAINASKMLIDSIVGNKKNVNIVDINKTNGDFTKYLAYKQLMEVINFVDKRTSTLVNKTDVTSAVSTIKNSINIVRKYSNEFKKAYRLEDTFIKSIYIAYVSGITIGTLNLISSYVYNNNGTFAVKDEDLKIMETRDMKALAELNSKDISGELSRLFKMEKTSLNENMIYEQDGATMDGKSKGVLSDILRSIAGYGDDTDYKYGDDIKIESIIRGILRALGLKDNSAKITKIIAWIAIIAGVFMTIRAIVPKFFAMRVNIADKLRESAEILERTNSIEFGKGEETIEKQKKIIDRYRKWADIIDVDLNVAESKADTQSRKVDSITDKEYKEDLRNSSDELDFNI